MASPVLFIYLPSPSPLLSPCLPLLPLFFRFMKTLFPFSLPLHLLMPKRRLSVQECVGSTPTSLLKKLKPGTITKNASALWDAARNGRAEAVRIRWQKVRT